MEINDLFWMLGIYNGIIQRGHTGTHSSGIEMAAMIRDAQSIRISYFQIVRVGGHGNT